MVKKKIIITGKRSLKNCDDFMDKIIENTDKNIKKCKKCNGWVQKQKNKDKIKCKHLNLDVFDDKKVFSPVMKDFLMNIFKKKNII